MKQLNAEEYPEELGELIKKYNLKMSKLYEENPEFAIKRIEVDSKAFKDSKLSIAVRKMMIETILELV